MVCESTAGGTLYHSARCPVHSGLSHRSRRPRYDPGGNVGRWFRRKHCHHGGRGRPAHKSPRSHQSVGGLAELAGEVELDSRSGTRQLLETRFSEKSAETRSRGSEFLTARQRSALAVHRYRQGDTGGGQEDGRIGRAGQRKSRTLCGLEGILQERCRRRKSVRLDKATVWTGCCPSGSKSQRGIGRACSPEGISLPVKGGSCDDRCAYCELALNSCSSCFASARFGSSCKALSYAVRASGILRPNRKS